MHIHTHYTGTDAAAAANTLAAASAGVVEPLQVEVEVKRTGPISSNLSCHFGALHFSETLLWDPQQLLRRARESLEEGGKGGTAVMVTVPAGDMFVYATVVDDFMR